MWMALVATFGEVVMNSLFKAFTGFLLDLETRHKREELGASKQREEDLRNELERINKASEAGSDPASVDPAGLSSDPNNRDNKP
jgi:hypothetical protein